MYGLLQPLYNENKQVAFESVYHEASSEHQMLMRSVIAEALKDTPKIIPSHGSDWILCTLASRHRSPEDTCRIYQAIDRKLESITNGLLKRNKTALEWKETSDIADSCLVCLGFFRKKIEQLHKRRAAPSINYYIKAGAGAFETLGYDSISDEFEQWIDFIENELAVTSIL